MEWDGYIIQMILFILFSVAVSIVINAFIGNSGNKEAILVILGISIVYVLLIKYQHYVHKKYGTIPLSGLMPFYMVVGIGAIFHLLYIAYASLVYGSPRMPVWLAAFDLAFLSCSVNMLIAEFTMKEPM